MSDSRFVLIKIAGGEQRPLTGTMPVGREAVNGLKLVEDGASRHHATLRVSDSGVELEDAGSRNGTFVNDKRITTAVQLRSGDRLRFDKEEYEFRANGSDATIASAPVEKKHVAGAWVDWNTSGSDGTERFTPEQLAEYLRKAKLRQADNVRADVKEPCLVVHPGAANERTIPLTGNGETQEWAVGRGPECAIRFDESDISEWHAKIVREGQKWKLVDAISSNGCFVNDLRVGMSYLASGDSLRFGRVECVFHLPGGRGAARSVGEGRTRSTGMSRGRVILVAVSVSFLATMIALYFLLR